MGMSVGASDDDMMMEMNTTPLIDVMLVLIVMLIITIPIQTHAVKLDMPRPNPNAPLVQPEVIDLVVDFDGTLLWNGQPVPNGSTLVSYFTEAAGKDPQPELHLRPNKLAKYDVVAKVLATAQRLHIRNIGIVGDEPTE
ncbi:MAG TPA: biopolymer transporter ExbD [Spongiibacteraceae bacterium]|nr:biopolymer transporter ExbD [Spongiibacteraceae bacterium]